MQKDYDILIVGGGLVGASLALALSQLPLTIGLVEAKPMVNDRAEADFDARSLALSYGSRRILESLGLWANLSAKLTPISQIHVSDRGHFGITRLSAHEERVPALGYVAELPVLGAALQEKLLKQQAVQILCPTEVTAMTALAEGWSVTLVSKGQVINVQTKLMVAADGGDSVIRKLQAIPAQVKDYGQTVIITNLGMARPHANIAYERFTDTGPLAMLPLTEQRCAMICTLPHEQVPEWLSLPDGQFLQRIQQRFGYRLGRIKRLGKRYAYPLKMVKAQQQVQSGLVLVGNAAHTLHPIAGQGFNLSLRDIIVLARVLNDAIARRQHICKDMLQIYQQSRQVDQQRTIALTDGLARIFGMDWFPLTLGRNVGLTTMELLPPMRHWLARRAMGLA